MNQNRAAERGNQRRDEILTGRVAAAPALGLRHLLGIAVVTPMILAAGVFWLHHQPRGITSRAAEAVVEVSLAVQEPVAQLQEVSLQTSPQSPVSPPASPVETPARSIQEEPEIAPDARIEPSTTPAKKSDPTPPAAPVKVKSDQTALVFQGALLSHIARYRRYPERARQDRIQGTVTVLFAMRRDGTVAGAWVQATSGNGTLDAEAVDTIQRAQPLPRIPAGLPDNMNILIPVAFNLP